MIDEVSQDKIDRDAIVAVEPASTIAIERDVHLAVAKARTTIGW